MKKFNTRIARLCKQLRSIVSKHSVLLLIILIIITGLVFWFVDVDSFATHLIFSIIFNCMVFCFVNITASNHKAKLELKVWRIIATTASGSPARTHAIEYLKRNGVNVDDPDNLDMTAMHSISEINKK